MWLAGAVMLARRPDVWYPEQVEFLFLNVALAVINGFVHWRILRKQPVTWRWVAALSAVDLALITANVTVNTSATGNLNNLDNLDNLVFFACYPSLALVLPWVTTCPAG